MSKKITSRDVAKAARVSQSLVSLILNNAPGKKIKPETRKLVLKTAMELNYKVNVNARSMKSNKAGAIGLLSSWNTNSFVFPPVVNGVQSVCTKNGLGVVVCTGKTGSNGNSDYVDYFLENRIDGLIYVSYVGVTSESVIDNLLRNDIPFVCVIGARDIPDISCVDVDFTENGYMAGKHLFDMGYRNIAYLTCTNPDKSIYAEKERYDGCRMAILESRGEIHLVNGLEYGTEEEQLLVEAENILKNRDFDAVVSISYNCFIILKAAFRSGIKVPEDIGVISLDNELYAPYLYPSLTTINEPLYNIAEKAMNILIKKIQGEKMCYKIEIPPTISVRESTSI